MFLILLFWFIVLIVSIFLLVKSSDWFTNSAEKIGLHFGLSPFVVGVTIVALGTSLPELISSIISVWSGASEIVFGNAIGSNIANILLVLGVTCIFAKKSGFHHERLMFDLIYLLSSTLLMVFFLIDKNFTLIESFISIFVLACYLFISTRSTKELFEKSEKPAVSPKTYVVLALSCLSLFVGAKYVVSSVISISDLLNFPKEIISASIVALGTSLPELSVSIIAARNGKTDVAIGNILGSNIFNLLGVVGISRLFGPLIISSNIVHFLIPFLLISTVLFVFITYFRRISIYEGISLLFLYGVFLIMLFF